MEPVNTQQALLVKMIVSAWQIQNNYLYKFLDELSEEQLSKEIAPGKNTGLYILGHLVAVCDGMLPLLGAGERMFPQLENVFIKQPDKSGLDMPTVGELKGYLEAVNAKLGAFVSSTSIDGWLEKHTAISAADFEKEPHRNKLNIIINRTNHLAYHLGQFVLLK